MAVNLENASLVLNTYDATPSAENTINTWKNINFRSLLGSMYDKYETFNLCLSTVITDPTAIEIGNGADGVKTRTNLIYMSGLPFTNQCYSTSTGNIQSETVLGAIILPADTSTTSAILNLNSLSLATFSNPKDIVDITIKLTLLSNATPNPTNDFPEMVFIFDIYGVEPKTKLIDHRIKNL